MHPRARLTFGCQLGWLLSGAVVTASMSLGCGNKSDGTDQPTSIDPGIWYGDTDPGNIKGVHFAVESGSVVRTTLTLGLRFEGIGDPKYCPYNFHALGPAPITDASFEVEMRALAGVQLDAGEVTYTTTLRGRFISESEMEGTIDEFNVTVHACAGTLAVGTPGWRQVPLPWTGTSLDYEERCVAYCQMFRRTGVCGADLFGDNWYPCLGTCTQAIATPDCGTAVDQLVACLDPLTYESFDTCIEGNTQLPAGECITEQQQARTSCVGLWGVR